MPPAIGALIVAALPMVATYFGASALLVAAITVASTIASGLLMKKAGSDKLNQGAELSTKIDPMMPRQVLAGHVATGGSVHFTITKTDDVKKPNRYLYRVIQLSDQPIEALLKVMDGNEEVTFSGDVTTGWRHSPKYLSKSGDPCCWMRVYKGVFSGAVADATLISESGGEWTSAHKGTGLAYAIIKLDSDPDAFPGGEPEFVFHVHGAKLYDDRLDSTVAGGSGAHRLATPTTWTYSDTASIIAMQLLRGFFINGVRVVGVGAKETDLTTSMIFSAHNTCEQSVGSGAGTIKRYAAGMILSADEPVVDMLEDLQLAMDGAIYDRGGSITVLPGATRTPVMNLTDDDIDWTAEKSWQPQASLQSMLNCVTGNFVDAANNFQEADLPVLTNSTWEDDDGGERFTSFFSFRAVVNGSQGQRITKRIHASSRFQGIASFVGGIWLQEMEQGDWFTLTSARWGFSEKYFEIVTINLTATLQVSIIAKEVSPSIDGWNHSVDEVPRTDTEWTAPDYDLPVPVMYSTGFTTIDTVSGLQTFNLDVGLVNPELYGGYVKFVEVEYRPGGATEAAAAGIFSVDRKKLTITGLTAGAAYEYRARTTDGKRLGNWTSWATAAMSGATKLDAAQLTYNDPVAGPGTPMDVLLPDTSLTIRPGGGVADNMVITDSVVENAITNVGGAYTAGTISLPNSGLINVQSFTLTTDGSVVLIAFSLAWTWITDNARGEFAIYRDAVQLAYYDAITINTNENPTSAGFILDTPVAGTYTYYIKAVSNDNHEIGVKNRSLINLEFKK